MTLPSDPYTIPGAAIGAETENASNHSLTVPTPPNKSLFELGTKTINAIDWHLSALTDEHTNPKYRVDPNASYYANGSLSILDRLGKFILAKNIPEANQAAFKIDHSESTMYSSNSKTTLGSLDIDTTDGYQLNPVSSQIPSSPFTPNKPWIKKIFPTLSSNTIMAITITELVQASLYLLISESEAPSSTRTDVSTKTDIAQIIVDNEDIENQLFNPNLI